MINLTKMFNEINADKSICTELDSKVLLIDGLNLFIRAFSVNPTMNDDGSHIGGITGFLNGLTSCICQHKPTRCIIVFDGKGGSCRRRKILPEYKMRRRGLRSRLNRTYDFGINEEKNATEQLIKLGYYLDNLPITTIMIDNIEADDVIAYLTQTVLKNEIIIMSTDRDFIPLITDRVNMWNPKRKKLYNPISIKEDYGFTPKNYLIYKIINGDVSDNISGIKGIGLKTIQKNLSALVTNKDYTVVEFLKLIETYQNNVSKKIIEQQDIYKRNYLLMQLFDVDISEITKTKIREIVEQPINLMNIYQLKKLFMADKLYHAIPNINSWLRLNFFMLNTFAEQKDNN